MDNVLLNGNRHPVRAGETLAELVSELGLDARWVVAELNGVPVARDEFSSIRLSAGDRLELVRPVAGG